MSDMLQLVAELHDRHVTVLHVLFARHHNLRRIGHTEVTGTTCDEIDPLEALLVL